MLLCSLFPLYVPLLCNYVPDNLKVSWTRHDRGAPACQSHFFLCPSKLVTAIFCAPACQSQRFWCPSMPVTLCLCPSMPVTFVFVPQHARHTFFVCPSMPVTALNATTTESIRYTVSFCLIASSTDSTARCLYFCLQKDWFMEGLRKEIYPPCQLSAFLPAEKFFPRSAKQSMKATCIFFCIVACRRIFSRRAQGTP